ncbi:MAG: peptidoglycan DD-metalloendopeptidase family protein, partial [Oscillospiraceae bacterium]
HNTLVAKCLHEAAPEAEIFCLSAMTGDVEANTDWVLNNNIDIVSTSYCPAFPSDEKGRYKRLKENGIILVAAAGNGSADSVDIVAGWDWTVAVGACEADESRADYSNCGTALDCLAYIPTIELEGRQFVPTGTSFAQPFAAGIIACFLQYAKEKGLPCDRAAIKNFIAANCRDIYAVGKDNESGYGLLCLPVLKEEKRMEYQYPFKKFVFGTPYGKKGDIWKCGWHSGLDLKSKNYGGDGFVYPICRGTVQNVSTAGSYGNHIYIRHPDGYLSLYAHLAELFVGYGEEVDLDTLLGVEGSTGNSTGLHLHLEIHKGGYNYPAAIDPHVFIENKIKEAETAMEKEQFEKYMAEYEAQKRSEPVSDWAKAA